ncbi:MULTISPECIES: Abi family protein [Staphylococcus]|uniref:Abi family protein n=1 Tax=Staphylococcus TaxID=1279 RepID=UPI000254AF1C|nr:MULTISPECIES: Abi family protein [Staphylococcus]MDW4218209.1 Abi family protein [Staphylococcus saprophyticus]EHY92650.1 hypothetical protein SSME_09730 [Staphylococcus saprophyticus subsp. saprophyticus KACC 16562]MDW4426271.1 Abi family protein [Staphylococcus saprophyticus]MDW4458485.1 Abi family protein [Staphylococcus saprophyticus]MEB8306638.1 Abi family protein [Staphylococcus xylosus]
MKYLNTKNSIEKMKNENIHVDNINLVTSFINSYGYYNVVNAYREILVDFNPSFSDFWHLFRLDHELKSIVLKYVLLIEIKFKHILSKAWSEKIGVSIRDYLSLKNHKGNAKSNINKALNKINWNDKPISSERYFIDFPPWVFLKSLPFGNSIRMYTISKGEIKDYVANNMITDTKKLKIDDKKRIFKDSIELLREFRNAMAHGNRLVNHNVKKRLNYNDLERITLARYVDKQTYSNGIGESDLLALFISILIFLDMEEMRIDFLTELSMVINGYESVNNQEFIDKFLSITKLPNNFLDILEDCLIIWQ